MSMNAALPRDPEVAAGPGRHAPPPADRLALLLPAWLEQTCSAIDGTLAAIVVRAENAPGAYVLAASWPRQGGAMHLLALAERSLASRAMELHDAGGAVAVAWPLLAGSQLAGVLALEVTGAAMGAADAIAAVDAAARYLNQVLLGNAEPQQHPADARWRGQAELLQVVCRPEQFPHAALDTVNWLAAQMDCSRVALGMARDGRIELQALSHSAWFDRKSQAAGALEHAMDEAYDQRRSVVLPPQPGMQSVLAIAHRASAAGMSVCSVLLAGGAGLGAGVLLFERAPGRGFTPAEVDTMEQMGRIAGPVLEAKEQAHRWVGQRTRAAWHAAATRLRDPRRPALRVGAALLLAAVLALTLVDTTWRISADAAIEGEQQRMVAAPFDGFIGSAAVKAGLTVRKGDVLAELDTRQIRLDLQRWQAEEAQHGSRYRDALARHDRPAGAMALAQMQQAQAQRLLAEDRLEQAALKAPFDAYVVSGDLSQHIGAAIAQGKVLFELAPLAAYRVVIKVDERDVRAVGVGQRGQLLLSGMPGEKLSFVVTNIAAPEAADRRNVFRVEAKLDQAGLALRPGMQGVGKIDAGQRSMLWIWTHAAWHYLVLQAWKWGP
ncbi:efflux RND transporter periplasmic adaptor subunit [Massilia sp. TWP1-3-3]|uniref:efflux RND transporter periplasmic adaptor subunit n=1 Tax=Massilia sp. TWP1-3-3 TaxID=2804573 RepID=UPI003CEACAC2